MTDVPTSQARRLQSGLVVAVCLNATAPEGGTPGTVLDVLAQSYGLLLRANSIRSLAGADIVVAPDLERFGYDDRSRIDELVAAGEEAANRVFAERHIYAFRWPWPLRRRAVLFVRNQDWQMPRRFA